MFKEKLNCIKNSNTYDSSEPIEIHRVPEIVQPQRIQEYGVGVFQNCLTKSALKKAIKKNRVLVNDILATTATYINGGERIELYPEKVDKPLFPLPLEILYEDDYLAVVHKPPGLVVSGNGYRTIANALTHNLTPSRQKDAVHPVPIHRLDFATTGALLIGKTASSIRSLYAQFKNKDVEKTYFAITIGDMPKSGVVDTAVDGKEARSRFEVLSSVPSPRFGYLNLVRLLPETGRRHQLRVHMYEMGHPILGDKDYYFEELLLKGKGTYLHAYSLKLTHPKSGDLFYVKDSHMNRYQKIIPNLDTLLDE